MILFEASEEEPRVGIFTSLADSFLDDVCSAAWEDEDEAGFVVAMDATPASRLT